MPLCAGCGSSYSDDFRFCPHCGRAQPEPARVRVEVVTGPAKYEEGTLRLVWLARSEKQLADKVRKGFLSGWKDEYVTVFFFQLELVAFHPTRNEYVAATSRVFRTIQELDYTFGIQDRVGKSDNRVTSEWYDAFIQEKSETWTQLNQELIRQGWTGITRYADRRESPSCLGVTGACDKFRAKNDPHLYFAMPETSRSVNLDDYRYRRVVSD